MKTKPTNCVRTVKDVWREYVENDYLDEAWVDPVIARSWRRCMESGVDPYDGQTHLLLKGAELENLMYKRRDMVDIAQPFMERIYRFVAGTGFIVMLTDEKGFILEALGDRETLDNASFLKFIKGANWSEEQVGTNAIGTAIVEKKPLQVSGEEHFCIKHHSWTCSAAPIFNDQGKLIGVLDMSGPSEKTHLHTLGIMVAAVDAIMFQMVLQQKNRELTIANNRMTNVFGTMSDGVIVLDKRGRIVQINPVAEKLAGLCTRHLHELTMEHVFPDTSRVKSMLVTGREFYDVETEAYGRNGIIHCVVSGMPIRDERGTITGGVVIINHLKKIRNLVNRFSGAHATYDFKDIMGKDKKLLEAIQIASLAADKDSNVLLQGESGTGKELFAQAIHNRSPRRRGPFVAINCGAIPRDLLGSELFGYAEGAFTGAKRGGRPGKFELASGGTLFLDEIGEMPLGKQVALLRAIQEKEITRIGDDKVIPVDVRIICATNKDLPKEVEKGNFRQDLFYRLNVISVILPPLRERREDIPMLFYRFVEDISQKLEVETPRVNSEVVDYIVKYDWPGNVRELQNVVERIINICNGQEIVADYLPAEILGTDSSEQEEVVETVSLGQERRKRKKLMADIERQELNELISKFGGNITRVAKELGVSRNTVYRKMRRYKIKT
ncbi:sigma-54-dependent Fis family transcriptional regulator [Syntrophomonas erecta]